MVQNFECKNVRSTVGCHWKDWICQTDTRLADARDKANERGLTRAEVTFYASSIIPRDKSVDNVLQSNMATVYHIWLSQKEPRTAKLMQN